MGNGAGVLTPRELIREAWDLESLGPIRQALLSAGVREAWLVGGTLRDLARGERRAAPDVDLAVPGDGAAAARRVAEATGGAPFPLDEAEGAWRVALARGGTVDVIPFRGPSIEADLEGRDFTVNAVALDLLGERGLLDPLGGLEDLAAGRLRLCAPGALARDPLRTLRAYRFAAQFGLAPDPVLPPLLAETAPRLAEVSAERIRTELFAILDLPAASRALRAMAGDDVLVALFPFVGEWPGFDQGDYHSHDLLEHSLRTAEAAAALAREDDGLPRADELSRHLEETLEAGVTRRSLLVLCAFLHDAAKPGTASWDGSRRRFLGHETLGRRAVRRELRRLRVGRRTADAAARTVAAHLRLFQLCQQAPPTPRARLRYLKDLGTEVPEALLLSLADEAATGPNPPWLATERGVAAELLELFWERRQGREVSPLLRGRDLVDRLGVPPGPEVGRILRAVEEAERAGEVADPAQALALARALRDGTGGPRRP